VQFTLANGKAVTIETDVVDKLIASGDGNAALLYLLMMRNDGALDTDKAAKQLKTSIENVEKAIDKLVLLGLINNISAPIKESREEAPDYTNEEIVREIKENHTFSQLVNHVESLLGKMLNVTDLQILISIYDWLGLPEGVIIMLVNYCIEETQRKYGYGKRVTLRQIQKVASAWEKSGIVTVELAEKHLKECEFYNTSTAAVMRILQISGRAPTPSEDKYIRSWIDAKISQELIEKAYDITVLNTNGLKWNYMDKILKTWQQKGVKSLKDLEKKEPTKAAVSNEKSTYGSKEQKATEWLKNHYKGAK